MDSKTSGASSVAVYRERVIAIDPGKKTGIAVLERSKHDDGSDLVELLYSAETSPDETVPTLRHLMAEYQLPPPHLHSPDPAHPAPPSPPARVVIEKFIISQRTVAKSQEASHALRTIGACEQVLRDCGYPEAAIKWQSPSQKAVFPNEKLKSLGLWHRGGDGHALDAIRHGALYLAMSTGPALAKPPGEE